MKPLGPMASLKSTHIFEFTTLSNLVFRRPNPVNPSIMSDESKIAGNRLAEALDLMVAAKWVKKYAQNINAGFAVQWTEKGESAIRAIFSTIQDLGPNKLNPDLWWSVMTIADQIFGPDGKGILNLDTTEI
jgi:hypothetical protein